MATPISDLNLAYNQILSASGLFIVQDSMAMMLECAPPEGHQYVINVINMTKGVPEALQSLASFWFHWFIIPRIVKAWGTRTPSHYSADTQNFAAPVEVKEWEGYHTSIYQEALEECETDEPITPVQISHIIPLSMNSPKKATNLGQMWDVIQSYGGLQPGTPKEGTAVKFVDHHNENDTEDLPNPQFLRLHAAVARVIHMSSTADSLPGEAHYGVTP
ncbi:hypothetical protein BS47DRAFT_1369144 [Hydnum rufescens UP504]|uniref:HNH nuclease domain-containing protein n=1 Tax=Hydnum rufescens UP504 TaxID=1448309 RepID=A0A9P6AEZ8_9AGAM|nr:hypothetical protein BS47DRAFT_1369144 [Hydnum rufescens UP504]